MNLMVLELAAAGIVFRRLPRGFWNIGVFIEQRGGAGGHRGGHNPPGRAWASRRAWCLVLTSGSHFGTSLAHWMSTGPKNPPKVSLDLDSVWY